MDVMIIFRIAGIGFIVSIVNMILKHCGRDEYAFFITLGGTIVAFLYLAQYVSRFFDTVQTLFIF